MRKHLVFLSMSAIIFMAAKSHSEILPNTTYEGENCPETITITDCSSTNFSFDCPNSTLVIECPGISVSPEMLSSVGVINDTILPGILMDIQLSSPAPELLAGETFLISGSIGVVENIGQTQPLTIGDFSIGTLALGNIDVQSGMTGDYYGPNGIGIIGDFVLVDGPNNGYIGVYAGNTIDITIDSSAHPVAMAGEDQVVFDEINLDATLSYDLDGSIESYAWLIENQNGTTSSTYEDDLVTISGLNYGFYTATLTVTDDSGIQATDTVLFAATGPACVDMYSQAEVDLAISEAIGQKKSILLKKNMTIADQHKKIAQLKATIAKLSKEDDQPKHKKDKKNKKSKSRKRHN